MDNALNTPTVIYAHVQPDHDVLDITDSRLPPVVANVRYSGRIDLSAAYTGGTYCTWQVSLDDGATWTPVVRDRPSIIYLIDRPGEMFRFHAGPDGEYSGIFKGLYSFPPYRIYTTDVRCNRIAINYEWTAGLQADDDYIHEYYIKKSSETTWSEATTSTLFTDLDPDTSYDIKVRWFGDRAQSISPELYISEQVITVSTLKPKINVAFGVSNATAFTFSGRHTCGYQMHYKVYDGETVVIGAEVNPYGENTVSGLKPDTQYRVVVTADSTEDFVGYASTQPLDFALIVRDDIDGKSVAGDDQFASVAYPRTVRVSARLNCENIPEFFYSDNGSDPQTPIVDRALDIYKPYQSGTSYVSRYRIMASLTIGDETYTSEQTWTVEPPKMITHVSGTFPEAARKEVNSGETVNVFPSTTDYKFSSLWASTWDDSTIIEKQYDMYFKEPGRAQRHFVGGYAKGTVEYDSDIEYDEDYAGSKYEFGPFTFRFTYGFLTTIASVTRTVYALPVVFSEESAYITATSPSFETIKVYGEDSETGEIEGISGERITFDSGSIGPIEYQYSWTPLVAELGTENWTPMVSRSDGTDSAVPGEPSKRALIPINTGKKFTYRFTASAMDDIGYTYISDPQRLTAWFVVGVGVVAEVSLLPDPALGAKNDTKFAADASKCYVQGYEYRLEHSWDITKNGASAVDKAVVISGGWDEDTIEIQLTENGTYLLTDTISGEYLEDSEWKPLPSERVWGSDGEGKIIIKEIIDTAIPDFSRFSLVVSNDSKCFVASRNKAPYFTDLKFGKSLSNIGMLSCKITGINKVPNNEGESVEDLLVKPGSSVVLLDRMNPVWVGVITETAEQDTNVHNQAPSLKIYNIVAYESTKRLAMDFLPSSEKGLVSGTITDIAKKIIPTENQGLIGNSKVVYGMSLANVSRLVALDSLYSQAGWKYRCRPKTKVYWKEITSGDYTISQADLIEGTTCEPGDVFIFYNNGVYGCGIVDSYESLPQGYVPSFMTTYRLGTSLPASCHVTVLKGFLVDFRPAYMQTFDTRTWVSNYEAKNVTATQNIRDEFGTAIVYGVGPAGEAIGSKMTAWMKINPDYTIDNSLRITRSYDAEVDTVTKIDEIDFEGFTYCRYAINFNGWSFPDALTLDRLSTPSSIGGMNVKPRVYFVNKNKALHYMELTYPLPNEGEYEIPENPRRYFDQNNIKKCTYTVAVRKGATVPSDDMTLQTAVIEALVPLSNVIFPVFAVDNIVGLPEVGQDLYVGDMVTKLVAIDSNYTEVKVDYYAPATNWETYGIPHGHLTDVLVMGAVTADGETYKPGSPMPDSPAAMYKDISYSVQGPEGYGIMELERLASRLMIYGSNFQAQGKANIGAVFFYRPDFETGAARIPMVGDRVAIKRVLEDGTEDVSSYELQRYEFDHENMAVSVVMGMPILEIGEYLFNMQANSGMSILPADS